VALRCAVGAFLADDAGKFRDFDFLCTKIPGGTRDLADINPCADCANILLKTADEKDFLIFPASHPWPRGFPDSSGDARRELSCATVHW
jgi:hypothetical protein